MQAIDLLDGLDEDTQSHVWAAYRRLFFYVKGTKPWCARTYGTLPATCCCLQTAVELTPMCAREETPKHMYVLLTCTSSVICVCA